MGANEWEGRVVTQPEGVYSREEAIELYAVSGQGLRLAVDSVQDDSGERAETWLDKKTLEELIAKLTMALAFLGHPFDEQS
jgi:hypothetical protein